MNERIIKACRREATDRRPIWLMRQSGRYLPEYREIKGDRDVLELSRDPEAASELAALPVEKFGLDAAIVFADIVTPVEGAFKIRMVEGVGPVVENPIKDEKDLEILRRVDVSDASYVCESVRMTRARLNDRVPIIGFSAAPFTLSCYLVEGKASRTFITTRKLLHKKPELFEKLMDGLAEIIYEYIKLQVGAGARVVQIFDSWAGCLSPRDYAERAMPYAKLLIERVTKLGVPTIYFSLETGGMLKLVREIGSDVIGVDWRVDIGEAWRRMGYDVAIQGNLDPAALLAGKEIIEKRAKEILLKTSKRPGHIFNLGHGVLPDTPPENVAYLVELVHGFKGSGCEW